jgi:hypothetical protein
MSELIIPKYFPNTPNDKALEARYVGLLAILFTNLSILLGVLGDSVVNRI